MRLTICKWKSQTVLDTAAHTENAFKHKVKNADWEEKATITSSPHSRSPDMTADAIITTTTTVATEWHPTILYSRPNRPTDSLSSALCINYKFYSYQQPAVGSQQPTKNPKQYEKITEKRNNYIFIAIIILAYCHYYSPSTCMLYWCLCMPTAKDSMCVHNIVAATAFRMQNCKMKTTRIILCVSLSVWILSTSVSVCARLDCYLCDSCIVHLHSGKSKSKSLRWTPIFSFLTNMVQNYTTFHGQKEQNAIQNAVFLVGVCAVLEFNLFS